MESLGQKIKSLRKLNSMTQTDLSKGIISKSMLSQIENDYAKPSMSSLKLLAQKLNTPVSYFLEDVEEYSLPLNHIKSCIAEAEEQKSKGNLKKAKTIYSDLISQYNYQGYDKLYGDILYKLAEVLGSMRHYDECEDISTKAINIYNSCYLYTNSARCYLLYIHRLFDKFDYTSCIDIFDKSTNIYNLSISKDLFYEIELNYLKSVTFASMSEFDKSISHMQKAIKLYKENNFYYKADELYQTLACIYMLLNNYNMFDKYITKAKQYAIFTENNMFLNLIKLNTAEVELRKNKADNAYSIIKEIEKADMTLTSASFYMMIKAKILYHIGNYKDALDLFEKCSYPDTTLLKHDYLFLWSHYTYHAYTLLRLKEFDKSEQIFMNSLEKLEIFQNSIYHIAAYKGISELYSLTNRYEKAFRYLKKATEMESYLEGLPYK